MSPFVSARTETFTAWERTCMKGTALFCLGGVPEGVNFNLGALKMLLWKNVF